MTYDYKFRKRVVSCSKNKLYKTKNIMNMFGVSNGSIFGWKKMDDNICPKRKRVSKILPHIRCYIKFYIIKRTNFDYKKLIRIIKRKFNVSISKSHLYTVIKTLNLAKKKISYKFIPANKKKRLEQIKNFKKKIKSIPMDKIISIDETSFDTHIDNNYGWGLRGKRLTVGKKVGRQRYTVICSIDMKNVVHIKIVEGSANGETFLEFMKELQKKIPNNEKFYLLLDNARIHHYKKLKEYVKQISNIELIYNVPYSPEYNPIENSFNEAKTKVKKYSITNNNIVEKIRLAFKKINPKNLKKYFINSLTF